jgi:hypothetical protein
MLKSRNGTGSYPDYGATKEDLNPTDEKGNPVLANVVDFDNLQSSNDMLL